MQQPTYEWKRYWCPRESTIPLTDNGFLSTYLIEYQDTPLKTLEELNSMPCLILLGEPGIGKTFTLEAEQVTIEQKLEKSGDQVLSLNLRSVGSEERFEKKVFGSSKFQNWLKGNHNLYIFLDSFDEGLLKVDTLAELLIDELQPYKKECNRLFLRIACRTIDWEQRPNFESELQELWGKDNFQAFKLTPLSERDVIHATQIKNISTEKFLEEVREREVGALASRPITLNMLFNIYQQDNQLPATKTKIYRKGCLLLCEEQKDGRRKSLKLTTQQRFALASRIAYLTIFSNYYAIWVGINDGSIPEENLTIQELTGGYEKANSHAFAIDEKVIQDVLETGLFTTQRNQQIGWAHHSYAEFLAATYTTNNLTFSQINSLLFHSDGKVFPQLHQIASWVASLDKAIFAKILEAEPQILLSSDIRTDDGKMTLVESLLSAYEIDNISFHIYGDLHATKLKHPNLKAQLIPIINDEEKSEGVRCAAIYIAEICRLDGLDKVSVKIALDNLQPHSVRQRAINYIAQLGEDLSKVSLKPLFMVPDQHTIEDDLKYSALKALWSKHIVAQEVFNHLDPLKRGIGNVITLQATIDSILMKDFQVSDLPIALEWVAKLPRRFDLPFGYQRLMDAIMLLAWKNFHLPFIQKPFVKAVFSRIVQYEVIIGYGDRKDIHPEFAKDLQTKTDKRRQLFCQLLALRTDLKPDLYLHFLPSLIQIDDLEWLINWFKNESTEDIRHILREFINHIEGTKKSVENIINKSESEDIGVNRTKALSLTPNHTKYSFDFSTYGLTQTHSWPNASLLNFKNWVPPQPNQLLKLVESSQAELVQNVDQLVDVLIDSLGRLQTKLKGENPSNRDIWDKNSDGTYQHIGEEEFSNYIKRHFDEDIDKRGIVASREVEIHKGKDITDIYISTTTSAYEKITVIIEVKGCWHKEVKTAMETQLLNRYLHENENCQHGLYLVGWFMCNEYDKKTGERKGYVSKYDFQELTDILKQQAESLSDDENKLRAFVLDASL